MGNFKFALNSLVQDRLTGYVGRIVARTEYLYSGSPRYTIQAHGLKDGKPIEPVYSDEGQLDHAED